MQAILILFGLLITVIAYVLTIRQAFRQSPYWGVSTLMPPVTLFFALAKWRGMLAITSLLVIGLLSLSAGVYLQVNSSHQSWQASSSVDRFYQDESELVFKIPTIGSVAGPVSGAIVSGEVFRVRHARFLNGALTLSDGDDQALIADREITVYLPAKKVQQLEKRTFDYLEPQPQAPQVHVSHRDTTNHLPKIDIYQNRQQLYLTFGVLHEGKLPGAIYWQHGDKQVTGVFALAVEEMEQWKQRNQQFFQLQAQLELLAQDYLSQRFNDDLIEIESSRPVGDYSGSEATFRFIFRDQSLQRREIELDFNRQQDNQWWLRGANRRLHENNPTQALLSDVKVASATPQPLAMLFEQPSLWYDGQVIVSLRNTLQRKGYIADATKKQLILRAESANNSANFTVAWDDVVTLAIPEFAISHNKAEINSALQTFVTAQSELSTDTTTGTSASPESAAIPLNQWSQFINEEVIVDQGSIRSGVLRSVEKDFIILAESQGDIIVEVQLPIDDIVQILRPGV